MLYCGHVKCKQFMKLNRKKRGRPKIESPKTVFMKLRATEEERELFQDEAERAGFFGWTDWVRHLIYREIRKRRRKDSLNNEPESL